MEFYADKINEIIDDYLFIQNTIKEKKEHFCTAEFKKTFNRLYTVRQKTKEWLNEYYTLFFECYYKKYSFKQCMGILHFVTDQVHPSLCSRIITTLNPKKPSWDSNVLRCMGINLIEPKDPEERIEYYSKIYDQIEKEYQKHLNDPNIIKSLNAFDIRVPKGKNLDDIKKLDLMIWSLKDSDINSILDYYAEKDKNKV